MSRGDGSRALRASLLAFAALRLAGLLLPSMFLWGLDAGRFTSPLAAGLAWLVPLVALVPAVGGRLDRWRDRLSESFRAPTAWGAVVFALAVAGLVFLLPDRTWFVGDFLLREGAMREPDGFRRMFPQAQPLDVLVHWRLPQLLLARGVDSTLAARALGALEAALLALLARRFADRCGLRGAASLAVAGAIVAGGSLALFAGYSKPTVEVGLFAVAIAVFGAEAIRDGRGLLVVTLAFAAALGFHRSAVSLLPGVLVIGGLAIRRRGLRTGDPRREQRIRGEMLAAAAVLVVALAFFLPRLWRLFTAFDLATNFTSHEVRTEGGPLAAAFSGLRLLDLGNLVLLHVPLILTLPVTLRVGRGVPLPPGTPDRGVLAGLAVLFLGHLPALLFVDVTQGPFRDWDAHTGAFAALGVLVAASLARFLAAGRGRGLASATLLAALGSTLTLVIAQHDLEGGLRRARAFLAGPPARTEAQRLATLDFLGLRCLRLERFGESADAFTALAADAPHPRALILRGTASLLAGRDAPAEDAFATLAARDSTQTVAWFGLLLAASRTGDSTVAHAAERRVLAYPDSGADMQSVLAHLDHYPRLWDLMPRSRLPGR